MGAVPDRKDYPGAGRFVPDGQAGLPAVAQAAQGCQGCDLFENATQTVFGRGAADAAMVLIGEQPGDAEDRAGQALFGSSFRITSERGTEIGWCAPSLSDGAGRDVTVVPTIHPSAVLRSYDRDAAYAGLVSDLRVAASSLRR